jgi:uncharacterized membrane protein YkvA (DUF1232 family)
VTKPALSAQSSRPRPGLLAQTVARVVPGRLRRVWRDALALLLALRDPRVPAQARLLSVAALIYALSPVDLLPDSLPVLGLGDDLLIVPALLALAARQLPPEALALARDRSERLMARRGWLLAAALLVALTLLGLMGYGIYRLIFS